MAVKFPRAIAFLGALLVCAGWLLVESAGEAVGEEPRPADLLLLDGRFYTVSSPGVVDGSMAIRDGRIVYLGPTEGVDAFRGSATEAVDLEGRAVTPGWIDAHSHLLGLGSGLDQVDLVGTSSYAEVVAKVAERARSREPGGWIRGRGWDQNDWEEKSFPTQRELSEAVPDHPVWLTRVDGHAALLNRAALEVLGLDATVADPSGGRFLRDTEGGLTGVLIDRAMGVAGGRIPGPSAQELDRDLAAAAHHALERGLTTVTEMGLGASGIGAYRRALETGSLPLRVAVFLDGADDELLETWFERGPEVDGDHRLQVRGIKLYADGALGSRGAALVEPYSDDPGNVGLLITGGSELAEICRRALETGFQVGVHAIGDRGGLVALDAFERCFGKARPEARFRVEHAQVLRLPDIPRMAGLGVIASVQPTHATSDMPWAEDRVGPDRILGAYAWRKMAKAGVRLALGSDFPVERVSPLLGFYAAITRQSLDGQPADGWYAEERLTRAEALAGFTLDAAYSLFLEDQVGSLEVGKRADVVVFERDPMVEPVESLTDIRVDLTLVGGERAFERTSG